MNQNNMEQSAKGEEVECGICLDALTNPVALPCSHKFCSECLNGWRSKFGCVSLKPGEQKLEDRKCPLCREKIPPTKEMVAQLKYWRNRKRQLEAKGDVFCLDYMTAKSEFDRLESEVGDWTETIDYSQSDGDCVVLPTDIAEAAISNDIQREFSIGSARLRLTNSGSMRGIQIIWILRWCTLQCQANILTC